MDTGRLYTEDETDDALSMLYRLYELRRKEESKPLKNKRTKK